MEKVFVGKIFEKTWPDGNKQKELLLSASDLQNLNAHLKANPKNGELQVKVLIKPSRNGKDYAEIDTWVPQAKQPETPVNNSISEDLPF